MIRAVDQATGRERHFDGSTPIADILNWSATPATREEQLVALVRELEGELKVRKRFDIAYLVGWTLLLLAWWAR